MPAHRADDAFLAPLEGLRLHPETEIYLGLVHAGDGTEGTVRRIAAARRHVPSFGVAAECGMARARTPEVVRRILEIHASFTQGGV